MVLEKKCRVFVLGMVLFMWVGCLCEGAQGQTVPPGTPVAVPYYGAPDRFELCGEPVPLDNQDARERFDREFTIVVYNHAQVYLWLKRIERYFPWIEKQLAANGLPDDLKYLAVAESDLMTTAVSSAGAAGPWQFIPSTGSNYGLNQSRQLDERHDFEASTGSAFRYLRNLHDLFQNWALGMAAYNCGEKRVQDEIRKQKVTSYYDLKLPLETERYIFRILAIKEVLSHPERYGYVLPKGAGYPPLRTDRVNVRMPNSMPIQPVAEAAGITYRELKNLNPALISDTVPDGSYTLKVPEGKGKEFDSRLEALKSAGTSAGTSDTSGCIYHKVERGETLSGIAARYNVSSGNLKQWNNLDEDMVRIGQTLKIMH